MINNEIIIFYAFRYCLGRQTYAVSDMVEYLLDKWNKLSAKTQMKIHGEIKNAIKNDEAGMSMDVKEWEKILELKNKYETT